MGGGGAEFSGSSQLGLQSCCLDRRDGEPEGGRPPARPAGQEQQPVFFGGLSGATSTSEPFRRSSCLLSDLHNHPQASVVSLSSRGQQGGACGCSWGTGELGPSAASLLLALPLPYPHSSGTRNTGPRRWWVPPPSRPAPCQAGTVPGTPTVTVSPACPGRG